MKICGPCSCLLQEDFTRLQALSCSLVAIKVLGLGAVNTGDRLWYLALCCVPWWASLVDLQDSSQNLGKTTKEFVVIKYFWKREIQWLSLLMGRPLGLCLKESWKDDAVLWLTIVENLTLKMLDVLFSY